jgi:Lon protease-like protein
MLPSTLPLFPLPNVVLFPSVFLPLHIFEPRYRQMLRDALAGDRMIGMALLKPGFEADYEGRPPIYEVGCAGLVTHAERLPDGRYNIILRGIDKFRLVGEEQPSSEVLYRRALVTPLDETLADRERHALQQERRKLEALLVPVLEGQSVDTHLPPAMADEDLVNALAQYLDFEPLEKLALLERNDPLARCRAMIELLEMRALTQKTHNHGGQVH